MRRDTDIISAVVLVLMVGVICFVVIGLMMGGKELIATVDRRWWEYTVRVRYDDCHLVPSYDSDGYFDGMRESCTTKTRCATTNKGRELPPQRPEIGCHMHIGDWTSDTVSYYVLFHEEDGKPINRTFSADLWPHLDTGRVVRMKTGFFGHIVEAETIK